VYGAAEAMPFQNRTAKEFSMASDLRSGDRIFDNSMFRSMAVQGLFFFLAVLMAMASARPALGQGTTTSTTTTTYADGATKSQDTTTSAADGTKISETETEYDEDGRPTSETETIYSNGKATSEHKKTWVYDDKGRLTYFETSDETYGDGVVPGVKSGYRVRKKYKDDKDTEGTTTQEQEYSSITGKWRDFDGDGGDTEPSKEPLQPAPPKPVKKPRSVPPIANAPLGEEPPASGTQTPEQPKNAPSTPDKPQGEAPPASGTQTPEKPNKAPLIPDRPLGEEKPASGGNTSSASPAQPTTIAIVLPANAQPGDTISGTATADPTQIAEMQTIPAFHITLIPVPQPTQTATTVAQPAPAASTPAPQASSTPAPQMSGDDMLAGVVVQVNGKKEPADQPLVAELGPTAEAISVQLLTNDSASRLIGEDSVPVSAPPSPANSTTTVPTETTSSTTPTETTSSTTPTEKTGGATPTETTVPEDYEMPPMTKPGAVEVIHGATSGNMNDMQIAVDGEPAKILTATPRGVFWRVPADLTAGAESSAHTVVFTRKDPAGGAPKSVTFPLYGAQIGMTEGSSTLHTGQSTPVQITVSIPRNLPASAWQPGTPPSDLVDLKPLEAGKNGLKPPKPNEEASIVVLIEDETPEVALLGKKQSIVLQLHQKDFTDGTHTYNTTLDTKGPGAYLVRASVFGFFKDAVGQASMNAGN